VPDNVTAKKNKSDFIPHPAGQFTAQCVDVIDLGEKVVDFIGKPKYLAQTCALVFRTGEQNPVTNNVVDAAQEFTVSMGKKANLRKFLEAWRGKEYSDDEADEGVPVHKLVGQWALIQVGNKTSAGGNDYAYIISASMLPKVMREHLPALEKYERAPYWADRKKKNDAEADAYRAVIGVDKSGHPIDELPSSHSGAIGDEEGYEGEDSLPF
jgi:hypothetical protein